MKLMAMGISALILAGCAAATPEEAYQRRMIGLALLAGAAQPQQPVFRQPINCHRWGVNGSNVTCQ